VLLNTKLRTAFVNAVLADISIGLDDDLIRKFVLEEAVNALPPAVRALYDDEATRGWVHKVYAHFPGLPRSAEKPEDHPRYTSWEVRGVTVQVPGKSNTAGCFDTSAKTKARVRKMQEEVEARMDAKDAMKIRLTQIASTCKTRAALADLLPHLEQYMPKPPPPQMVTHVPAVMVKDMMKELKKLGVPAQKEAVAA
jgi:hypothetical protein